MDRIVLQFAVCVCPHPHPHLKSREINCFRLNSHDYHWKSLCEYSNKPIQFEIKLNFCPTMWFQCCWIIQVYTLDVDFSKFYCMNPAVDQMLDARAQTNTNTNQINNSGKNPWMPIENGHSFNALSNWKAWINSPFCCFIHWLPFSTLIYISLLTRKFPLYLFMQVQMLLTCFLFLDNVFFFYIDERIYRSLKSISWLIYDKIDPTSCLVTIRCTVR